ncbi:VOC family protein [Demequina lignilytica]|uniref:VOC family protein n=1 Tax=Demequina lignilytica TaxID=3051663 RepID=A0AB35MIN9_9MICO|nr:VOC family protein [Demequina sp. SYSU T0a273]MDN4483689.1 VOC family protein [Demequina sp. SYSU T0a273]
MTDKAIPFLMFQGGVGREAVALYTSLFEDGEILDLDEYPPGGPAPEGTIMRGRFRIAGQEFYVSDSFIDHEFGFTPSLSIWIEAGSAEQQERLVEALADGGATLMPLDDYGFSSRFAWVNDRFGVSWQINLA